MNRLEHFFFVPKNLEFFLSTNNNEKPKLWKRKYREEILKNEKEPVSKGKKIVF